MIFAACSPSIIVGRHVLAVGMLGIIEASTTLSPNVACHEAIASAIGERDFNTAEARMAEHFDNSVKLLLAAGIN